mmetsp:Transcript_7253/g.16993  ORF Transcript_7253/g.16993 Transcript_7253/m.16993 type:complete len:201 (-) Transcript_7253:947-1549(-)
MSRLKSCRCSIFSSIEPVVTMRQMRTSRSCPGRCTRAIAWLSGAGFQSQSYSTILLAAGRLKPVPPARVESRKANCSAPERLKLSTSCCRLSVGVLPSSRTQPQPRARNAPCSRSSERWNCAAMTTLSPASWAWRSSLMSTAALPVFSASSVSAGTRGACGARPSSSSPDTPLLQLHRPRSCVMMGSASLPARCSASVRS